MNKFSGSLDVSYQLSAEIDGSVKDIMTLNGAQLAGHGISATGTLRPRKLEMRLPKVRVERLMHRRTRAWTKRQSTPRETFDFRCMLQGLMPSTSTFGRGS